MSTKYLIFLTSSPIAQANQLEIIFVHKSDKIYFPYNKKRYIKIKLLKLILIYPLNYLFLHLALLPFATTSIFPLFLRLLKTLLIVGSGISGHKFLISSLVK